MRRPVVTQTAPSARDRARRHGITSLFVLVVALGLFLRVDTALRVQYPTVDGVHYLQTARDLARDGHLDFSTFPPGWPLLIAAAAAVHGETDPGTLLLTAQATNVVLGTLAGVLVFLLVRRAAGAAWALLAATLFLLLPDNVIASANDLSESSFLAVSLAAWLVAERRFGVVAGALFGFAYLVRPEALIVLAAYVVVTIARERRVPYGAMIAAGAIVLANVVFMRAETGTWMLSSKNAFLENAVADQGVGAVAVRYVQNAVTFARSLPEVIGVGAVALAVLGVVIGRGRWWLALLPVLLLPLFTFRMEARYWLVYVPFLLVYAALGARWIGRRWPRPPRLATTVTTLVLLATTFVATRADWKWVGANFEYYPGMVEAGVWLSSRVQPEDVVLDYKPYVAFWADANFRKLPAGRDAMGVVDWARENGADYLVVNAHLVGSLTPELAPLLRTLSPDFARKISLVHVATIEGDPRQTTLVYRVEPVAGRPSTN